MVALSRCFSSLALFLSGVEGARISRKVLDSRGKTKFIAGVPVFEYDAAYGGKASLGELESDAEGEWILLLKPKTPDAAVQRLCKLTVHGCNLVGHPSGGVPFLEFSGTEADLEHVINGAEGAVKFVTPDQEDFLIPEQPSEHVGVQAATWGLTRIGADSRGRTGAGATIYVHDTGVRVAHQEFGGRAESALDLTSGRPVECNGDLNCAGDRVGHGTNCAGTAAGATVGVAPGAAVRAVKTLNDGGSGARSWQFMAVDWVAANGVRPAVISMSMGSGSGDPVWSSVIDAAVNAGVTVVVAAGDSNSDSCRFSPAFVTSAITVGSTDANDKRSSFSNYGACTNIWAPGVNVRSAGRKCDTCYSTRSGGTSMACPHVSGGAALVLSANPSMKPSAVLAELLSNAAKNVITDLKSEDTNALLYVGDDK